jgi:hypothetical protein
MEEEEDRNLIGGNRIYKDVGGWIICLYFKEWYNRKLLKNN